MTAVRSRSRFLSAAVLGGTLLCAPTACGSSTSAESAEASAPQSTWQEPSSYAYTLTSSEGERNLLGTFRVTVRDGKVVEAVGLDESGRRVTEQSPAEVPTIGGLLEELEQARRDRADTAEAKYAADGHPLRISLDWDENAIDDEALYVIGSYVPD
jgi:hypothetical protein